MDPDAERRIDVDLLAGGAEAFGRFYARHEDFVLAAFARRVGSGSPELVADLTAETFARALATRHLFDDSRGAPRAWLYGIVRHVFADSVERRQIEDRVRRNISFERLQAGDTAIARIEALSGDEVLVLAALDQLPDDQRLAVRGHVLDEISYEDLALVLCCTPNVVRQRVSRGLRTLRQHLKELD
jgi:RNA polymerase sigma-70 factor (ECF subfamily)